MAGPAGRTYGFGRVSPDTRPSPYSLVELRGRKASPADYLDPDVRGHRTSESVQGQVRRKSFRRAAAAAAALLILAGGSALIAAWRANPERDAKPLVANVPAPAPPLSEEAARLIRSAIAVARYTPRL